MIRTQGRNKNKQHKARKAAIGRYTIANENAFDWLKRRRRNSVHAVVSDPPFGVVEYQADQIEKRRNGSGGIWRLPRNDDGWNRRPVPRFTVLTQQDHTAISKFQSALAKDLFRVLVPGGHVFIASQTLLSHLVIQAFVDAGFELRGQLARTVQTLRGGDRPKFAHVTFASTSVVPRSSWEPWLILRKPCEGLVKDNLRTWGTGALRRPSKDVPFKDLIPSSPARNGERSIADHPSLKPQAFMRQVVRAALPLGTGVLLDPFMGSGSTIGAARALGIHSIGLEIDKVYFAMAKRAIPALAGYSVEKRKSAVRHQQKVRRTGRRRRKRARG